MQAGKLPLEYLSRLLGKIDIRDPRVVLGPMPGEDAALIDFGDKYLVAKTDPITFATDHIGWYLLQVNANDLAVMGATPRWLMVTLPASRGNGPARRGGHIRPIAGGVPVNGRCPGRRPHRGHI